MKHHAIALLLCGAASLVLTACGGGAGGAGSNAGPGVVDVPGNQSLSGAVYGGQAPVSGSAVTLYAVGEGATAAIPLASGSTDANGKFTLSGYGCPTANTPVYIVAHGGNPGLSGGVNNSAIHLLAALGACSTTPATVNINEIMSVAAAYALNAFADVADADNLHGASPGLANAIQMAERLADPASGGDGPALIDPVSGCGGSAPVNCDSTQRLNSLANALAACVNTASGSSAQCTELFDCASAGATYTVGSDDCMAGRPNSLSTDSWQAILEVARNPGAVSMDGLYDITTRSTIFKPSLATAPNDWTLSLNFSGVGLSEPTAVAVDADGNVWIANYNDRVVKLAPDGSALSGASGFHGGGLHESFGLAINADGNVWVTNEETPGFNSGHGSVTKLASDGSILSGAHGYAGGGVDFPQALAIDANNNVWIANTGKSSISELTPTGTAVSPTTGFTGGGVAYPIGLAFDPVGDLWVANQAANEVSKISPAGVPLSPDAGYTAGGLDVPQGIAVDGQGNVWVSNYYGSSVTELDANGVPIAPTAYKGGGLSSPGGIAIDGAGRVWVANYNAASISELAGANDVTPGAPLSPATGFGAAGNLLQPYELAIDASGNVWVSNFGGATVSVLIGAAAPVTTPRIGVPMSP